MFGHVLTGVLATSLVATLQLSGPTAQALDDSSRPPEAEQETVADACDPGECDQAVEDAVGAVGDDATEARRKDLIDDAVEALEETRHALRALDEGETESALESLAVATGKLELVVARNPNLALAPIGVRTITYDVHASLDSIEAAKKKATRLLKDDRLQEARALVEGLRSDLVIEVSNLPLATYPNAIKAITPLIDDGKVEEAKVGLQAALNTIVVTQQVHALPILRTEEMLTRAEELATNAERTGEQNAELKRLLDGSRRQLELAEALGYGEADDFEGYFDQLDEIADKTSDGKSGTGFFEKLRRALRSFHGDDSAVG